MQKTTQPKLKPIILASTSPRRLDLMKQVSLPIYVIPPNADETPQPGESPKKLVQRLSTAKAQSAKLIALKQFNQGLIISADTIVVAPQSKTILGKPTSKADAKKMLKLLSGKVHSVFTGYCILDISKKTQPMPWVRVVESRVKIRPLSEKTINAYISTGEPMDKAGSYGAQGIGTALIESIQGSYTNVVGLPMTEILLDLESEFNIKLLSWIR